MTNTRRCDCENSKCTVGHPDANCQQVGTVKTIHNTVCAKCAACMPVEYLRSTAASHTEDADCTLDANGECTICHVLHGDPCMDCGGRGFHKRDCILMDRDEPHVLAFQTFPSGGLA